MSSHLQCKCAQHRFPWPFCYQSLKCDRISHNLLSVTRSHLLSHAFPSVLWHSCFWLSKVTFPQVCHSCLHLCPNLPAPLKYHLLKFLLQATFLHPNTFLTMSLPQPSTNLSTFSLPRHSWKYIPLIFLVSAHLVSSWPPL